VFVENASSHVSKCLELEKDVPTEELPRNMLLAIDQNLVQSIVPGTRVIVMGIYSIYQANNSTV